MIRQGGAKAISVASSYRDGAERVFLDSPKAEWLWEYAEANDIVGAGKYSNEQVRDSDKSDKRLARIPK
jgi:hypothetical protein